MDFSALVRELGFVEDTERRFSFFQTGDGERSSPVAADNSERWDVMLGSALSGASPSSLSLAGSGSEGVFVITASSVIVFDTGGRGVTLLSDRRGRGGYGAGGPVGGGESVVDVGGEIERAKAPTAPWIVGVAVGVGVCVVSSERGSDLLFRLFDLRSFGLIGVNVCLDLLRLANLDALGEVDALIFVALRAIVQFKLLCCSWCWNFVRTSSKLCAVVMGCVEVVWKCDNGAVA